MLIDALSGLLLATRASHVVRGEPYVIGGRCLTPLARIAAFEAASGRIRFQAIEPIGIVEEVGGETRLLRIGRRWDDPGLRLAVLLIPIVVFVVATVIVRARRG